MKQVLTPKNSLVLSSPLHHSISQRKLFSKYRFLLLLAVIAMLVSSCHKEDEHVKKTFPFKVEFVTTLEIITDGAPGGILEKDHITGKGEGTPVGKATFDAYAESDIFAPEPQLVTGTQTTIAGNGDQIFSTFKGYAIGPDNNGDIKMIASSIITGGTGKYAGATGSLTTNATASVKTPTGKALYEGSITY